MSQILKQSTSVTVRVGPAVDATDAVTPETTLDVSTADQAEALKAGGAATVDISGNTFAAVTGSDGWYDLTLTSGNVDTVGDLTIVIQDSSLCLPILARFQVVEEAIYDALFASSAGGFDSNGRVDLGNWLGSAPNALSSGNVQSAAQSIADGALAAFTSLANLFRLLFRSDSAINTDASTTLGEINASQGSGAGDYDNTADSAEAIRDRGDSAWVTATGFSTHDDPDPNGYIANLNGHTAQSGDTFAQLPTNFADLAITATTGRTQLQSGTGTGQADWLVDLVWDEIISGSAHNTANSAGRRLRQLNDLLIIRSNTAQAGGTNTITLDTGASATDGIYNKNVIRIKGGTGQEQSRAVVAYNGTTKVATVDEDWDIQPDGTSEFELTIGRVFLAETTHDGATIPTVTDVTNAVTILETTSAGDDVLTNADLPINVNATQVGGQTASASATVDFDDLAAILVDTNSLNDTKITQTLNLTPSGNIGIDWANVENPGSGVDLSATDFQLVDTVTDVTNGVTIASSEDVYQAQIVLAVDDTGGHDEWVVAFWKNGVPVSSGVTSPTIEVKDQSGNDLVTSGTSLSEIGSTHAFKYQESSNRVTAGEAYVVTVQATIDGNTRTFGPFLRQRDST